ncbi:MAG: nicotinate (nicotinamide) nucleotide adenylyltransferase [Actinobacteria bacterium]|nr:nicotinate (nicotinamide) nucleotide adenylyltransferase [Actinomycetota bacterium]
MSQVNKEFAIFGGTFDPIHLGHLHLIKEISNKFEKVLVIPSGIPWLKGRQPIANAKQRFQMADLAVTAMGLSPKVEVLPLEVNREGNSYAIDTVTELKQIYPNTNFTLVLGADAANNLGKWHRSEELLKLAKVLVIKRPGASAVDFDEISIKALDISSTKVRDSIAKRENVSNFLPAKVVTFIREYGLYGSR